MNKLGVNEGGGKEKGKGGKRKCKRNNEGF